MSRSNRFQNVIEEVVDEVLEAAMPRLRTEIIERAVLRLESLDPAPGSLPTDLLNAAVSSIQDSSSQVEILRHLLEGVSQFCGRGALFVVKAGSVTGWQATGFENNDAVKGFSLAPNAGLVRAAIEGGSAVMGQAQEFDSGFITSVGIPADGNCVIVPLTVKEKVAALIYADVGQSLDSTIDGSALTLLCRFAGIWLELTALRKAGIAAQEEPQPAATAAAAAVTPSPVAPSNNGDPAPAMGEEDDLHKKARRYARLLVDEIKLYNQSKVAEGKRSKDLYERLREDIEKSRAAYDKRFGTSPAASANYFTQELVRILADNDISLMGGGFPH